MLNCKLNKTYSPDKCIAGTFRDSTVTSCTKCAENSISEQTGTASCTSCPTGKVSNEERTQCGNVLFTSDIYKFIFDHNYKQVKITLPKSVFLV